MQDLQRDITESIKSGEYFKDAREWYALKYIHPVTQRSFLIVIAILSVLLALIAVRVFTTFLPLVEIVPIVVDVESKVTQYTQLKVLGKPKEDSNESLIKYLVVRYIDARESYDYDSFRAGDKLKYLKDFSSREVFDAYKADVSFDNPESPILLYKQHTTRRIEPIEVVLFKQKPRIESGVQKLTVKFRAKQSGREASVSTWLAKIEVDYQVPEYSRDINKFSPLNIKVVYYEVTKLSDE